MSATKIWAFITLSLLSIVLLGGLLPTQVRAQDSSDDLPGAPTERRAFPTGATPTAPEKIQAAAAFEPNIQAADQFAVVPAHLQYWGNDRYGICVTAEEAFAKLAYSKMCGDDEIRVSDSDCIAWARRHGVLNGADLLDVMQMAARDGLPANGKLYTTGVPHRVNWKDESELRSALATGPVKLAIASNDLPRGAGSGSGWWSIRSVPGNRTDHAVALCGYGPASYLYGELGLPAPQGLAADKQGYLLFTWSTIGFVSHDWLMGAVSEAWVRVPTTVGEAPKPPVPPPTPEPKPEPTAGRWLLALALIGGVVLVAVSIVLIRKNKAQP